jgi:hypothetical protein
MQTLRGLDEETALRVEVARLAARQRQVVEHFHFGIEGHCHL